MSKNKQSGINLKEFETIDDSKKLQLFIDALKTFDNSKGIQDLKKLAREKMPMKSDMRILDVGCGIGLETHRFAEVVEPDGFVVGVDISETFLKEAISRNIENNPSIQFLKGQAEYLPFSDHTFHCTRAERLLLYVSSRDKVLKEFIRVTKPHGYICFIEPDWETNTININNRCLVRKILNHDCDKNIRNAWVGRELPMQLKSVGIHQYEIETRVIIISPMLASQFYLGIAESAYEDTIITKEDLDFWKQEIKALLERDELFCTISYFLFFCRCP